MFFLSKLNAIALAAVVGAGSLVASAAPASALPQCASNASLRHVHQRLDGAIDQLQRDDHDYNGHRLAAVGDLSAARAQLVQAERYAQATYGDDIGCFRAYGRSGYDDDFAWGRRGQYGSNRDIWGVRRWIVELMQQLNGDDRDYGGHKAAAIRDMQAARDQMVAAERFAYSRGY